MRRFLVFLPVLLSAPAALARPNDFNLVGLSLRNPDPNTRDQLFKQLVTELGVAIGPQFTSPSQTLGSLGFEVGLSTALTNIHQDASYWQYARRTDETVDGALAMTTLHIRKGLPASFELGANIGWLARS